MKDGSSRIKHRRTLSADFDAHMDLLEVDDLIADASNVGGGIGVQVDGAKSRAELVGLDFAERRALCGTSLLGDGVVVALGTVAIASQNNNTVNFRVRHR